MPPINLHYFNSKKQGELDFIFEQNGNVIPIEVKSGKNYERHNALKNVMEDSNYAINRAYVLCNNNVTIKGNICYVPIYMTMFIEKHLLRKSKSIISTWLGIKTDCNSFCQYHYNKNIPMILQSSGLFFG